MPRHGMGRQVQRSSAGSTPHDRIRILQICSSHPPPLQWPRQSASRDRPVVTNRPTTYRIRRDPPLIQRPFHHPPACWSASTPFTRLIRGTQIPIALAATPTTPSRGFLPSVQISNDGCNTLAAATLGGLRTPAPGARRATVMGPPSANLHKSRLPKGTCFGPLRAKKRYGVGQ